MRKRLFNLMIFAAFLTIGQAASIGTWKAYMAYHDISWVEKGGNTLFVLASDNLYSYNLNDESIQTYDKINALSDCDISMIAWNNTAKRLMIVYKNYNIDLMAENGDVENISDYYNKSMTDNKTINDIYISDKYAYLSTGFGILKVNMAAAEISETYNLGFNVNYCYIDNGRIYAASSSSGIYSASTTDNLLDKNVWTRTANYTAQNKSMDAEMLAIAKTLNPGGPKYNTFGYMQFHNGKLYSCNGISGANYDPGKPGTVQVLDNDEWIIYQDNLAELTGHKYVDLAALSIDPTDNSHVAVSGRTGLYEFKDGVFTNHFNNDNSPIKTAATVSSNSKNYVMIQGMSFDNSGNLWCLNSISPSTSILEYTKDKEWVSHHKTELTRDNHSSYQNMTNAIFDSRNLLWFGNNHWDDPSLICYQPQTDAILVYHSFTNEDGITIKDAAVQCVMEDNEGNIWFGTTKGLLMLESSEVGNENPTFTQVKVPRNDGTNLADYLLSDISITCMAVDGAGRKWFGSGFNGVYLISADNMEQIQHFTADNSSLLSNTIQAISINSKTGEVFFGTNKGLCSYMSDATETNDEMTTDNVYAYPNPVRPGYTGLITVTGLTMNADVKIVTTNGVLVAQGRSNGGTFTWDGNDLKGKRVASGIYMVETATADGNKGTVCKIAIVN